MIAMAMVFVEMVLAHVPLVGKEKIVLRETTRKQFTVLFIVLINAPTIVPALAKPRGSHKGANAI
jgi:hypothetical protein